MQEFLIAAKPDLQAARQSQAAKAFREMHPGQTGVVTGAEELRDRDGLRVVVGHDPAREIGDAIRVGFAHAATIGNVRSSVRVGGPVRCCPQVC